MSIPNTRKFAFLTDLHFGYERDGYRHKTALHDLKAFGAAYAFLEDFKPDILILGGDILDCGAISHHARGKPRQTEGLRLLADANECRSIVMDPLERLKAKEKIFITGNHEDWINDFVDENPGVEGMMELRDLLNLHNWWLVPQGGHYQLGKLAFVHGDQLKGGENVAKAAVVAFERSVRFGHFHTYSAFTKTSALDLKLGRTGIAVPCLCRKNPKYGEGLPNRWQQGINYGYVFSDGTYRDFVSIILDGKMIAEGKLYRG